MLSNVAGSPRMASTATFPWWEAGSLVGQHWLSSHIAYGVDVRIGRSQLLVHLDKATLVHLNLGLFQPQVATAWFAADCHQNAVEFLFLLCHALAFQAGADGTTCGR
jgi:hypothetical protein